MVHEKVRAVRAHRILSFGLVVSLHPTFELGTTCTPTTADLRGLPELRVFRRTVQCSRDTPEG